MKSKNIFFILFVIFASFFINNITYAAELIPDDVLGEIPGHFFVDDSSGEDVYAGVKYFEDGYTLSDYKDSLNLSSIYYLIPIKKEYLAHQIVMRYGDSWPIKTKSYSISCIEDDLGACIEYGGDYYYRLGLNDINWGVYYSTFPNEVTVKFSNTSDELRFNFKLYKDINFLKDSVVSDNNISGFYNKTKGLQIYRVEEDNRLVLEFNKDVQIIDDNFDLSILNNLYGNPSSAEKTYIYIDKSYGYMFRYSLSFNFTYRSIDNFLIISFGEGIPSYEDTFGVTEYGYDFRSLAMPLSSDFNPNMFPNIRDKFIAYNPVNMCNVIGNMTMDDASIYLYPPDNQIFRITPLLEYTRMDSWSPDYENGPFENEVTFDLDIYKVSRESGGYEISTDVLGDITYNLYYEGYNTGHYGEVPGYDYTLSDIKIDGEDLPNGLYRIEITNLSSGDLNMCNSVFNTNIHFDNIVSDNNFKNIYEYIDGGFAPFYGDFSDGASGFKDYEDILGDDLRLDDLVVDLDNFQDFQIVITSLDGVNSVSIDKNDGFDEYNQITWDKLDEIYDMATDDYGNNLNGLYILDYYTLDNAGYVDEYSMIGYMGYYYSYFYQLNLEDIIDTISGVHEYFNVDLIDSIEIRDLDDNIIYPCIDDSCEIVDIINNKDYYSDTLKLSVGFRDYNQTIDYYFTIFDPGYVVDNLDYIRSTSNNKPHDFTTKYIDRLPINFYDLDDGVIGSFKIGFYDELGTEIYSIDDIDDLIYEYHNYDNFKTYLKQGPRAELLDILKSHEDEYIYYTVYIDFVFDDDPEYNGILYYKGKYFNSGGYFTLLNPSPLNKSLDIVNKYDLEDGYDDCGDCNVGIEIQAYTNSASSGLAPMLDYRQSENLYFSKKYDFSDIKELYSFYFDGLWIDNIDIVDLDDQSSVNINNLEILICQTAIDSFDNIPNGCMNYDDILELGVLVPSSIIYIYGFKPGMLDDDSKNLKVNIKIDIYGYFEPILR